MPTDKAGTPPHDMLDSDAATDDDLRPMIPWRFMIVLQVIGVVAIVFAVYFSYIGAFPFSHPLGLYRFLPGDILIDFIWIYVISAIVGALIYYAGPNLSLLLWKGHRVFTGGGYDYHLQTLSPRESHVGYRGRLFVPAFVCLGLSSALSSISSVRNLLFVTENFEDFPSLNQAIMTSMPIFFILLLLASFITIFFAPVWLLEDTGIICERDTTGGRFTADVEGVGNWYLALLKGFAGISTLVAYLFISLETLEWYQLLPGNIDYPLLFYLLPVIVIFMAPLIAVAPISLVYVLYELSLRKNVRELERRMKSKGLKRVVAELPRPSEPDESE